MSIEKMRFSKKMIVLVFVLGLITNSFAENEENKKNVQPNTLTGKWYPANTETLRKQIEGFFQKAEAKPINNVIAFVLPHAGYRFSGQTAANALKTINRKYKRVVIIGPTHYVPMEEMLSVPDVTHCQTPLGQVPLDSKFINKLLEFPNFQNIPEAHKYEHSVQIELPLLQYSQKDFKIVPIVAGRCSQETIEKVGSILKGLVDEDTLVIASSDFTHYGPNYGYIPFEKNVPEQIKKLDMGAYEFIDKLDYKGFLEYKQKNNATICGYIPVAILLSMLEAPIKAELIKYTTSGEITADYTNSVSYLSVAFSGTWPQTSEIKPKPNNPGLTEEDKRQLLNLARKTIFHFLQNQNVPSPSKLNIKISDAMKEPRAAFVTLKKNSQLRGCIGDVFPRRPLYKSITANAINAAVNDRRFNPLEPTECNDITIEISALTVPKPVASPNDIRIGIDGIVLRKDGKSALYLPQVAPEQGWNTSQTLTHLSLKAGLAPAAWKKDAQFLTFQAIVFGEDK